MVIRFNIDSPGHWDVLGDHALVQQAKSLDKYYTNEWLHETLDRWLGAILFKVSGVRNNELLLQ